MQQPDALLEMLLGDLTAPPGAAAPPPAAGAAGGRAAATDDPIEQLFTLFVQQQQQQPQPLAPAAPQPLARQPGSLTGSTCAAAPQQQLPVLPPAATAGLQLGVGLAPMQLHSAQSLGQLSQSGLAAAADGGSNLEQQQQQQLLLQHLQAQQRQHHQQMAALQEQLAQQLAQRQPSLQPQPAPPEPPDVDMQAPPPADEPQQPHEQGKRKASAARGKAARSAVGSKRGKTAAAPAAERGAAASSGAARRGGKGAGKAAASLAQPLLLDAAVASAVAGIAVATAADSSAAAADAPDRARKKSTRRRVAAATAAAGDTSSEGGALGSPGADSAAWRLDWAAAAGGDSGGGDSGGGDSGGGDTPGRGAAAGRAAPAAVEGEADSDIDQAGMTTQEKNRTAQRRFRQRQKAKMASLEQQVSQLSATMQALGRENSTLKHMNNILEKAMVLKDEHIAGLQEALRIFSPLRIPGNGTPAPNGAAAAIARSGSAAAAARSGSGTSTAAAADADGGVERPAALASAAAAAAPAVPAAAAAGTAQQPPTSEDSETATAMGGAVDAARGLGAPGAGGGGGSDSAVPAPAPGGGAEVCSETAAPQLAHAASRAGAASVAGAAAVSNLDAVVSSALAPDFKPLTPDRGYTAEVVAAMSPDDVVSEYARLVGLVRSGLVQLESPDAPPGAISAVEVPMRAIGALCERVAFYKPRAVRHLLLSNADTHERAVVDVGHWRRVVGELLLSAQQAAELLAARSRFLDSLTALLQRRARVKALLDESLAAKRATHIDVLSASLAALDAHELLSEGVGSEHTLHMGFIIMMFKQVMSPLQVARGMVAAWPFFPDPLAISNVLQEQQDAAAAIAANAAATGAIV